MEAADALIAFTERPRAELTRGGRHVEFGMALAWRKRVLVVGPRETVFHTLGQVEHFWKWGPQVIEALTGGIQEGDTVGLGTRPQDGTAIRHPSITLPQWSQEGDEYHIVGMVRHLLREAGVPQGEVTEFTDQAMDAGPHDLMDVVRQWVTPE